MEKPMATKSVWFQTTSTGQRTAYYWSPKAFRAFRMSLAEAELLVATEQAVNIGHHPLKAG